MTKDELIQSLNGYEWNDFECKKAQKGVSKDAYTNVSAFANTQTVPDIPPEDFFDKETVSWYQNVLLSRDPGKREIKDLLKFLIQWNFVQEKRQGLYPTRAGILLFGKPRYINQIIPRPILEYRQVGQPFDNGFSHERWMDRFLYEDNLFETWRGLVARYMRIAERPFALDPSTMRRIDDPPDYIAFKEAAINLLVHQDYGDHRRKACIHFFTDCTRFWNPGDAFSTLEELLKTTEKEVRNPALISAFRRIGLSDHGGTGIPAIFKNWNDLGRVPPRIENDKAGKAFLLTLETKPLVSEEMRRFQQEIGVRLTKEQADTLAFAIITPVIRYTDIRTLTSLPYPRIKEIADYLVHQMLLQETGDGGFALTDTIRRRYEHVMKQRDHVGTKSAPSRHQVGTKSALSRHQVKILTACNTEQAVPDLLTLVGRTDRTKFRTDLLNPLLEEGLVEMTIPDKPKSSKQRYRTTEKGLSVLTTLPSDEI